jgi:RNA 2',3'-cyclic 3'-phosphodiesterase
MLRLFVALPVPDEVAERIVPLQRGLEGAKWSPRENLHITLRFLGDVSERQAEDVDAVLGQIHCAPFDIALKGAGHFGGDQPHAAWLGVLANPALTRLHDQCEKACRAVGLPADTRVWTPHVTLAYFNRTLDPAHLIPWVGALNLWTCGPWLADRFYLYSSRATKNRANIYQIEAEYPLIYPPNG